MVVAEKGLSRGRGVLPGYARMFADVPGGSRFFVDCSIVTKL
jgi:hypothetical protein